MIVTAEMNTHTHIYTYKYKNFHHQPPFSAS